MTLRIALDDSCCCLTSEANSEDHDDHRTGQYNLAVPIKAAGHGPPSRATISGNAVRECSDDRCDQNCQLQIVFRRKRKKPYSAVTVQIDRLTSEQYEEDDISGIIDLVDVIRIQASGPMEAARALRKKLKYGNTHRQLRALVIIDGLIQNAGSRFQRTFADEPLLERLRMLPRDDVVDPQVRQKCKVLFVQWANGYKGTPGLERIANLYKELPKSQRPATARQRVLKDSEPEETSAERSEDSPFSSSGSRSRAMSLTPNAAAVATPSRPVTTMPASSSFSSKLSKSKEI
nr:protein lsb5 [Quercus suber]